jgi:hypothetical protein
LKHKVTHIYGLNYAAEIGDFNGFLKVLICEGQIGIDWVS